MTSFHLLSRFHHSFFLFLLSSIIWPFYHWSLCSVSKEGSVYIWCGKRTKFSWNRQKELMYDSKVSYQEVLEQWWIRGSVKGMLRWRFSYQYKFGVKNGKDLYSVHKRSIVYKNLWRRFRQLKRETQRCSEISVT